MWQTTRRHHCRVEPDSVCEPCEKHTEQPRPRANDGASRFCTWRSSTSFDLTHISQVGNDASWLAATSLTGYSETARPLLTSRHLLRCGAIHHLPARQKRSPGRARHTVCFVRQAQAFPHGRTNAPSERKLSIIRIFGSPLSATMFVPVRSLGHCENSACSVETQATAKPTGLPTKSTSFDIPLVYPHSCIEMPVMAVSPTHVVLPGDVEHTIRVQP